MISLITGYGLLLSCHPSPSISTGSPLTPPFSSRCVHLLFTTAASPAVIHIYGCQLLLRLTQLHKRHLHHVLA